MERTDRRPRRAALAAGAAMTLLTAACGGSSFDDEGGGGSESDSAAGLQVLIASSGDAETEAVEQAAQAWAEEAGTSVEVVVAQDIAQQLAQGFAGGNPPDVFYVDAQRVGDLAGAGNLFPYTDQIDDLDDFVPSLRETFTVDGVEQCVPKDFSTLALQIREDAWAEAGLTDADVPTTWEQLQTVAQRLTTPERAGLVLAPSRDRLGAFMVQAGGWFTNEDQTEATATSPENTEALTYVSGLLESGAAQYAEQLDSGWGGEAFGTGRAAMAIEGNWIRGAMRNDYPDVEYRVAELPQGPAGPGTLLFTQCWGIAADSDAQDQAVDLVTALTSPEQQLAFAEATGVMPSRQSVQEDYQAANPDDAPFVAGAEYGQGPVNAAGTEAVMSDFDSQLLELSGPNVENVLESVQQNLESALG